MRLQCLPLAQLNVEQNSSLVVHKADLHAPALQQGRLQLQLQRPGALQCQRKAAGSLWAVGSRCSEQCRSQ